MIAAFDAHAKALGQLSAAAQPARATGHRAARQRHGMDLKIRPLL